MKAVNDGEAIFGPGVAQRLINFFSAEKPPTAAPRVFPELTSREEEILTLIAQGHGNKEIAERLYLSLKTVRNHVSNIFTKLQVADRAIRGRIPRPFHSWFASTMKVSAGSTSPAA